MHVYSKIDVSIFKGIDVNYFKTLLENIKYYINTKNMEFFY